MSRAQETRNPLTDNQSDDDHTDRSPSPLVHLSSEWKPRGRKEELQALLLYPWWLLSRSALKAEMLQHGGHIWNLTAAARTPLRGL